MAEKKAKNESKEIKKQQIRNVLLEKQNEAKMIRKIVSIICLILILAVGGSCIGGYFYIKSAMSPVNPEDHKAKTVEVPIGSGVSTIGKVLEDNGIIKSALIFKYYVKLNNEAGFQAGTYQLTPSMTFDELIETLKTGTLVKEVAMKITIPEGWSLQQIADTIAEKTDYQSNDILEKLNNREFIEELMGKYPNLITEAILNENIQYPLEGYLFPATYSYYETNPSLENVIEDMLKKTNDILTKYKSNIEEKEMDPHELLTLASLIEKEATEKADRHKISSVFYNRIETGMPLQTDPTVLYALGEHKKRVLYEDLEVDSPYNTYKVKGLPPGPIANAGETSIEAALNPEETDYLYFLAETGTGEIHYSHTLEEHNEKKAKYIVNKK